MQLYSLSGFFFDSMLSVIFTLFSGFHLTLHSAAAGLSVTLHMWQTRGKWRHLESFPQLHYPPFSLKDRSQGPASSPSLALPLRRALPLLCVLSRPGLSDYASCLSALWVRGDGSRSLEQCPQRLVLRQKLPSRFLPREKLWAEWDLSILELRQLGGGPDTDKVKLLLLPLLRDSMVWCFSEVSILN